MRSVLSIILCFWIQWGISQNYLEKTLEMAAHFQHKALSASDSMLLDTSLQYIQKNPSDTSLLNGLNNIAANASSDSLADAFNLLVGEFAQERIQQLGSENVKIYQIALASYYLNAASSLSIKNQVKEALELRYKALDIYTRLGDTVTMVKTLIKLGTDHFNAQDYEQSEKYYRESIRLMDMKGDSLGIIRVQESLGAIFSARGDHEASIPYFQASLDLAIREKNYPAQAQIQYLLGRALLDLSRYDEAKLALDAALQIYENFQFGLGISVVESQLTDLFIQQKKWKEALAHAERAFEIAQQSHILKSISTAAQKLFVIHKAEKNYSQALEMLELHTQLKDSLKGEANTRALVEQRLQFEYEQQAKLDSIQNAATLSVQVEENRRRKTTSYFLVLGLILAGIFAFILYNRFRITQKQRNQLDLANEKLKELDQSKSRFFTNISHEFRTPLTVISGMADLVGEPEPRELIKRNSQSLLSLVNQILDLRKLESGKLPLHMQQGDVIPFLKYLLESFQSYAEDKGVGLSFSSEMERLEMDYDPEKLHSIVTNLISNAIKFTPEGGRVSLQCAVGSMQSKNPKRLTANSQLPTHPLPTAYCLLLTVSDSGKGIPKEKLPNIFDRFYQADDSSTRTGEGTGIGLTLTQELVNMLEGEIHVESELGKGTTFQVVLPVTQKAEPLPENKGMLPSVPVYSFGSAEELPAGAAEAAYKLLIVEDNEDVVRYLQACLNDLYQISVARDGQEGIEKAIEEVPDIIISDVMMPRKDGFELCETLKHDERTSHIPIILLTAKADAESRISGLKRGADAYLAKPFDREELLVRLEMLIKLRQQLQARYQAQEQAQPAEDVGTQYEDAFIQKLNEQIHPHLSEANIPVPQLCEWMGMSRTQLHNKVKALTGRSITNYVRFIRLKQAKQLLEKTDKTISEIAYETGFNDPAYFTRSFVKEYGFAPSEGRG